jgi:hypothetical protein
LSGNQRYDARASSLLVSVSLSLSSLPCAPSPPSPRSLPSPLALGRPHPHPPSHLTNPPPRAPLLRALLLAKPPLTQRAPARVASCRMTCAAVPFVLDYAGCGFHFGLIEGEGQGCSRGWGRRLLLTGFFGPTSQQTCSSVPYATGRRSASSPGGCTTSCTSASQRRRLGKGGRMCFVCVRLWRCVAFFVILFCFAYARLGGLVVTQTDVFFRDVPLWASALGSELPCLILPIHFYSISHSLLTLTYTAPDLPPKPSRSPSS